MKLTVKKEIMKVEKKEVNVELIQSSGCIILMVDGWCVFEIRSNGKGYLPSSISSRAGLQVDEQGRIVLEN